jgi:hypothetical protein
VGFSDAGFVTSLEGNEQSFLGELSRILPDTTDKSISEIMGRWDIRGSYDLMTSGNGDQGVFSVQNNITNMWAYHKLDGFLGFTASFGMKLVWNTPPVYQGAYILAYVPPGVPVPSITGATPASNALGELMFLTGCQHVIFNLAESTSAELIVPYVGPNTFIPVSGKTFSGIPLLGHFVVRPISNARSATTISTLPYTAYVCLKDLKTYGARAHNAELDSSMTYGVLFSQSGFAAGAEAVKKSKLISTTAGSISSFLGKAGKYIPDSIVPSGLIDSAAWATGGVSKIADLLGWAKPSAVKALEPVCQLPYADISTADATFACAKFAMNNDAGIGRMDLSGRGVDEMQISEVLARPNLFPVDNFPVFVWNSSQGHGSKLFEKNITPTSFHYQPSGTTFGYNTQLSYVATMFGRWRGSINLRFMPICTKFHSGRLRAVFVPWGSLDESANNVAYSYTHIIDIRDSASWDLTIPYMAQTPWLDTTQYSGKLVIYVDVPLVASSGAVDNIDIASFVSGGPTIEFAIPGQYELQNPYFVPGTLSLQSQAGIGSFTEERSIPVSMAPDMDTDSVLAHNMAMGDPVRSLRALCKKFWVSRSPVWNSTSQIGQMPVPLIPHAGRDVGDIDMISTVAGLFAFWRGGTRIYAQNYYPVRVSSQTVNPAIVPLATPNGQYQSVVDYSTVSTFVPVGMMEPVKVELPYNFESVCRNTFIPGTVDERVLALSLDYYLGSVGCVIQRAMADDFDMGTLIGAPLTGRFP